MALHMTSGVLSAVSYKQFRDVEILVGKVINVQANTEAKIPAYLIEISFGEQLNAAHKASVNKQFFKSSAQLCSNHSVEDIQGNYLMSVVNFPRKQIGSFKSDCLITGAQKGVGSHEEKRATTVYLCPTQEVPAGSRVGINGQVETIEHLKRELAWDKFCLVDLRIGTIMNFAFQELNNDLGRIEGRVAMSNTDQTQHFMGLVHKELVANIDQHKQLMFWANPLMEEVQENLPLQGFMEDTVLLCTVNGGKAGIKPAKKVDNGFRVA